MPFLSFVLYAKNTTFVMQKSLREIFNSKNLSIELHTTCKPICKPEKKQKFRYTIIIWDKYKIYNKIRDTETMLEWWIRWWLKILWHLNAVRVQVPLRVLLRTLITCFQAISVFCLSFLKTDTRFQTY